MAAARTPAATVPLELKRQGERLNEQLGRLQTILTDSSTYLEEMSNLMGGYSEEIVTELNKLKDAVDAYKTKSTVIYTEVSNNLINYANNLICNLDGLRTSISNISQAVENL